MLDWKEIKGYDRKKDYLWQDDSVELPQLGEEILIHFENDIRPDRPPFVGYFKKHDDGQVWIHISANDGMSLYEVQDGVRWARFNREN